MKTIRKFSAKKSKSKVLLTIGLVVFVGVLPSCNSDDSLPEIKFDYQTYHEEVKLNIIEEDYYEDGSTDLIVEIYDPLNNIEAARPLILLSHGGGLISRTQVSEIKELAQNLAKRGYVTGYFTYSLFGQTPKGWVRSVIDAKTVVRYFKKNAEKFRIDPDNIFTGGWSNGAHTTMNAAHMSQQDIAELSQPYLQELLAPEIEVQGFDGTMYPEYTSDVKGNLLMLPYTKDVNFFDEDGPAVMMIASPKQQFTSGKILWDTVYQAGVYTYGPDLMEARLKEVGYVKGENYDLEVVPDDCCGSLHPNESILAAVLGSEAYKNDIAKFFSNNLD